MLRLHASLLLVVLLLAGALAAPQPSPAPEPAASPSPVAPPSSSPPPPSVLPEPVIITPEERLWIIRGLLIATAVSGIFCVALGYRVFKLTFFLLGCVFFFFLAFALISARTASSDFWLFIFAGGASLGGGFLMLGLGFVAFPIAVFTFALICGAIFAFSIVAATPILTVIAISDSSMPYVLWGVLAIAGLVCAVVAVFARRWMLIFLFGLSLDTLLAPTPTALVPALLTVVSEGTLPSHPAFDWHTYLVLSGMGLFWALGVVFQARLSARNFYHEQEFAKAESDEYKPLLIQNY